MVFNDNDKHESKWESEWGKLFTSRSYPTATVPSTNSELNYTGPRSNANFNAYRCNTHYEISRAWCRIARTTEFQCIPDSTSSMFNSLALCLPILRLFPFCVYSCCAPAFVDRLIIIIVRGCGGYANREIQLNPSSHQTL